MSNLYSFRKDDNVLPVIEYNEFDYFPYSDKQIFNLIADVESYPEFVPGWISVDVKFRSEKSLTANQKIGLPLVNWKFSSTATLDAPRQIQITANDGPFENLNILWQVEPVTRQLCRVTLSVKTEIHLNANNLINSVLEKSVHSLLTHFKSRAAEIYGN